MLQVGGDADLAQEPLGAQRVRQLGTHSLMATSAIVLQVVREETVAMPPRPSSRSIV